MKGIVCVSHNLASGHNVAIFFCSSEYKYQMHVEIILIEFNILMFCSQNGLTLLPYNNKVYLVKSAHMAS